MPDNENSERWFTELVEMAPEARAERLAQAPDDLRPELERLLAWHAAAGPQFLEPAVPERIGPYRPIAELGRGGMGVVYLALRASPPLERPVALKLLPRLASQVSSEIRVLARLEHPNIARFLDAGVTDDGLTYLAMQYIEGVPIDAYCREHHLRIGQRLRLFLKACAAVSYAHQQLVLLCDLKPEHILVDGSGEPQLLDFGIARLLDAEGGNSDLARSYMTPGYASPEQMRGEALTTASDIYGLGAVLGKLIEGGADADLQAIQEHATAAEPCARYGTVEGLADDLRRSLDCRPPRARPGPWAHRLHLGLRRHRRAAIIAAVIALLLLGGLVGTYWQMLQARREAQLAERRGTALQELAAANLLQLDDTVSRLPGGTAAREALVVDGLNRLQQLAAQPGATMRTRYDIAFGYLKLAQLQGAPYQPNLGRTRQALANAEHAEGLLQGLAAQAVPGARNGALAAAILAGRVETRLGHYGDAAATLRRAAAAARAQWQRAPRAISLEQRAAQATLNLGDPLLYSGHFRQAARAYQNSLALSQDLLAREPHAAGAAHQASEADYRMGSIAYDEADWLRQQYGLGRAAAPLYQQSVIRYHDALDLSVRLMQQMPGNAEYQRWHANVEADLGEALGAAGAYGTAVRDLTQSVRECTALASADPANEEAKFDLEVALSERAKLEMQSHPGPAHADLWRAEALGAAIHARDSSDAENSARLAWMYSFEAARQTGPAAVRWLQRSLALSLELDRLDPQRATARMTVLNAQASLARALYATGEEEQARAQWEKARHALAPLAGHARTDPAFLLRAARIEITGVASRTERQLGARFLRAAMRPEVCHSVDDWLAVTRAYWAAGRIADAVATATHALLLLPRPVQVSAAQIKAGLWRTEGRPGQLSGEADLRSAGGPNG